MLRAAIRTKAEEGALHGMTVEAHEFWLCQQVELARMRHAENAAKRVLVLVELKRQKFGFMEALEHGTDVTWIRTLLEEYQVATEFIPYAVKLVLAVVKVRFAV